MLHGFLTSPALSCDSVATADLRWSKALPSSVFDFYSPSQLVNLERKLLNTDSKEVNMVFPPHLPGPDETPHRIPAALTLNCSMSGLLHWLCRDTWHHMVFKFLAVR